MDEVLWPPAFQAEFEVLEVVGAGGMARVYRARQRATGRDVAIKVLAPQAFSEEDTRRRFEREREVTAALKHPNIVPLLSFGDAAGRPYLVFEFIDGESLRDALHRQTRIPLVRALRYARHIAQALAAAHQAGIVHRDLKPDNVLVARSDDEARVADFGLARETTPTPGRQKLTQTGIILGTPGYLSPEMIRGEPATTKSDLFSLGIMLYEMITGQLPLDSNSEHELLIRYLREDLPPISARGVIVPQRVERLVATLLRRDVARRPDDASKVVEALAAAEAKGDAPDSPGTRPPGRPSRPNSLTRPVDPVSGRLGPRLTPFSGARFIRQHPTVSAAGLAMLAALVVGAVAGLAYLAWPGAVARPRFAVLGSPTVLAGATSASIRWRTDQPIETRIVIRPESAPDSAAKAVMPPAGAPPSGTGHELTVRGLSAGQRWVFAVVYPDGTRSPETFPVELRPDVRQHCDAPTWRYSGPDRIEVGFEVKSELTAGVMFPGAAPVWAPSRGPRKVTIEVPVPKNAEHAPAVVFRELDDESSAENAAKNRLELPRFVPLDTLRKQVVDLFRPPFELTPVTNEIFRQAAKVYGVGAHRTITKDQVRTLDELKRKNLLDAARTTARQRLLSLRQVDLDLVASALPFWGAKADLPAPDKRRLHQALMRLADLDGACQLVAGVPLYDIDRHLGLRVPPPWPAKAFEGAYRPLDHYTEPAIRQVLAAQALPCFTHTDFGDGESVMGIWVVAGGVHNIVDALKSVAIIAPDDPRGKRGLDIRLPPLPDGFSTDGRVRVKIAAASMSPEFRLWLRIGRETEVCFRTDLAEFKGFGAEPMRSPRADILERRTEMVMDLPAGYLEPGARELSLRLEAFPTHEGGTVSAPMLAWVSDLAVVSP